MSGVTCQESCVMCQVSGVRCPVSGVRCQVPGVILCFVIYIYLFVYQVVGLVGGGSVINGAYPI